eukprot:Tbor_TRINITY_DN5984_c0_g1::TRINITY_DN5984_c0_g1_i13::g.18426::m.18426
MEDTKTETSGQVEHEDTSKAPGNEKKDDDKDGENSQKEHEVQSQAQEASADSQQPGSDSGKGSDPSGHSSEGGDTPTEKPIEDNTPLQNTPGTHGQQTKTEGELKVTKVGTQEGAKTVASGSGEGQKSSDHADDSGKNPDLASGDKTTQEKSSDHVKKVVQKAPEPEKHVTTTDREDTDQK